MARFLRGRFAFWMIALNLIGAVYHPIKWSKGDDLSLPGMQVKADKIYGHKDGMAMTYDVFTPTERAKGIGLLFMVSGGWVSAWAPPEKTADFFRPLLDQGYTVFAVRHGSSPRYQVPDAVSDVKLALEHIAGHAKDYDVAADRLGVFGFSAGGHLSLILGTQTNDLPGTSDRPAPHIAAVVAVFPPTDLAPYVELSSPRRKQFPALQFDPARSDAYSPIKHVTQDDAPTLLIHGDQDDLVPLSNSETMHEALDQAGVSNRLVVIEGAGHGFNDAQRKKMFAELSQWFDRYLLGNP